MNLTSVIKAVGRGINRIFIKNKKKIMLESNSDYCDNTAALYDYMIQSGEYKDFCFVWCVKNPKSFDRSLLPDAKITSFHNRRYVFSYLYQLFTSKYVIYTHFVPPFCNKNAQTVINMWHGIPLKSIKGHCHSSKLFSYLCSTGELCDELLSDGFEMSREDMKKQMLRLGYPRNDILFKESHALSRLCVDKQSYKKILLWMPTFRRPLTGGYEDGEATQTGLPLVTTLDMLSRLNDELEKNELFMFIKLHPGQDMSGVELKSLQSLKMLTNSELAKCKVAPYELLASADILLTDYSSVYMDYLLLNRPIGFIIDDIESYNGKRGFTVENPLELMPGEHIKTIAELYDFLKATEEKDEYFTARAKLLNRLYDNPDGESARRIANRFFK